MKKVWKGGPKSKIAYRMDYYRKSKEPWEKGKEGKHGVTSVKPHYKTVNGTSTTVQGHHRHY